MKRLIAKQIFRNLVKLKENIAILWLITILSSFMYFFVQCSIDGNMPIILHITKEKEKADLLTALNSNAILSKTFLVCFICILCFLYYMFLNRFLLSESRFIGYYKTLGFKKETIIFLYLFFFSFIIILGHLIGMGSGFYASDILISSYKSIYHIEDLMRGLHMKSILSGVALPVIVLMLLVYKACSDYTDKQVCILLSGNEKDKSIFKFADYISAFFKGQMAYGIRITLRKPVTIILMMLSVFIFNLLFLFSISLNLSSKIVYDSQLAGRFYKYSYDLDIMGRGIQSEECDYLLKYEGNIVENKSRFAQDIVGIQEENKLFKLMENGETLISGIPEDGIVINPRLQAITGISKGNKLTLEVNGRMDEKVVVAVAGNADINAVYMNKRALADLLDIEEIYYNTVFSKTALNISDKVITMEEWKEKLDSDNVSNRISAVICQLLAMTVGCLLLFLSVLLNFEGNFDSMMKLRIMGYREKEINNMLVSIYRPILIISFILTLYPGIYAGKAISDILSLQTGDYMPFNTNFIIIILIFLLLNLIYSVIKYIFEFKVKKIVSAGEIAVEQNKL